MTTTDAGLLRAYAESRSETAFAGLVERRIGFVYATALRETGGDAHLSQDVAQAVFSLAAKKAGELAGHERLAGWLYTTTTHIARRERRNAHTRARYEKEAALMNELQHNEHVSDVAGSFEKLRPLLNAALDALRKDERESVLLRFFEGRTFGEIGARLKMSEDAARMRVSRAIEKMRAAFARRGVTSSAAALGALLTAEAAQASPAGLAAAVSSGAIATAGAAVGAAGAGALAGVSATAANVLVFMSTTKMMTTAAVVLALAIGGAFYGAHSERAAGKLLADAKRKNNLLLSRLRAAEEQMKTSQAKADEEDLSHEESIARGQAFMNAYPKVRETLHAFGKARAAARFYRLRSELGMTDEQWEEFLRIRGNVPDGFGFVLSSPRMGQYNGMTINLPEPNKNWREDMRAFLGDAGFARFQEEIKYNNNAAFSSALAAAVYFTDAPLSDGQAKRLDELVSRWVSEHKAPLQPEDDNAWNAICAQASGFLSESQIEALNNKRIADAWRKQWFKIMDEYRAKLWEAQHPGQTNEQ